jgi:hypothetical protein
MKTRFVLRWRMNELTSLEEILSAFGSRRSSQTSNGPCLGRERGSENGCLPWS